MDIQLLVESNRESKQSSPKKLQNKEPPMLPSFNSIAITAKMSQVNNKQPLFLILILTVIFF